jgi:hypothetical protein
LKLHARFRIIGFELVGLGAFLMLLIALELGQAGGNSTVSSFAWVFVLIGITIVLVGLETLSLTRRLQSGTDS